MKERSQFLDETRSENYLSANSGVADETIPLHVYMDR